MIAFGVVGVLALGYAGPWQTYFAHGDRGLTSTAVRPVNLPPASREEQRRPLGVPMVAPPGSGGYRFENLQRNGHSPVTWDPCRPVHYVVSGRAPEGAEGDVASVVAELSRLTGLRFVDDGPTSELPSAPGRQPYQPSLYGRRWAPVLVAWTDPARVPKLAGEVIGLGGANHVAFGSSRTYVSGIVYLDAPQFGSELARPGTDSRSELRAVVLHEFGHLLGLAHVSDRNSVMFPESDLAVSDYSPGDRRGLRELSLGDCAPTL